MLSQYSWGDYIKFVLICAVLYYAFVLWKYYRQDIREWLSNRNQGSTPAVDTASEEEDEEDESSLYTVTNRASAVTPVTSVPVASPASTAASLPANSMPAVRRDPEMADGPVLAEEQPSVIDLPLGVDVVRTQEESLDSVLETAKTLVVDQEGAVTTQSLDDEKAKRLVAVINQQQGNAVFSGMPFNR